MRVAFPAHTHFLYNDMITILIVSQIEFLLQSSYSLIRAFSDVKVDFLYFDISK